MKRRLFNLLAAGSFVLRVAVAGGNCYNSHMSSPIKIDPDIQGGTPCFSGTRVPVKSLFDALARGRSLDYFLQQFPSVTREQAVGVLDQAGVLITSQPTRPKVA